MSEAAEQLRSIMSQFEETLNATLKPKYAFKELELNKFYPIVNFVKTDRKYGFDPKIMCPDGAYFPPVNENDQGKYKFKFARVRDVGTNKNGYQPSPVVEIYFNNELLK